MRIKIRERMKMSDWLSLLSILGLVSFIAILGPTTMYSYLGGSFGLLTLYPLIVISQIKYKEHKRIMWSLASTIAGIALLNGLYSYYKLCESNVPFIFYVFVISFPTSWIATGYAISIEGFVEREIRQQNDIYKKYVMYYVFIIMAMLSIAVALIYWIKDVPNFMLSGIIIIMGSLVTMGSIFAIETSYISIEHLEAISKPIKRISGNAKKVKGRIVIAIIIALAYSSTWELYRGYWLLWLMSIAIISLHLIIQYNMARFILQEKRMNTNELFLSSFPSFYNKRTIIVGVIFIIIFLFISITILG